jgi:hypothetical protein
MSGNPDVVIGTIIDPTVAYGPSATHAPSLSVSHKESEPTLLTDGSLDGPVTADGSGVLGRVDWRKFSGSPVGWLLILLPFAYLAYHHVYGAAS